MITIYIRRIAIWIRPVSPFLIASLAILAAIWAVRLNVVESSDIPFEVVETDPSPTVEFVIELPAIKHNPSDADISRLSTLNTIFPDRPRMDVVQYTVKPGDSVFGIAELFNLEPETVLWGNYEVLNDDPHLLKPGQSLNLLPVDGTYYQWQQGDTIEELGELFGVDPREIVDWPGNKLNPIELEIEEGHWLVIPNGRRTFQQWFVPTIARGSAGVGRTYGPGGCSGDYSSGLVGTGGFIWPTTSYIVSGNDYWSGHLAIDIGVPVGAPIFAADSGVVVFAGWAYGGYGNMVMIDHGNGWQTLYAHLNQVNVGCGQNVIRESTIAGAGSTGNSTGPHLHFETRYLGGFVNPRYVLP